MTYPPGPSSENTSYSKKDVRKAAFNVAGTFGLGCAMLTVIMGLLGALVIYFLMQIL